MSYHLKEGFHSIFTHGLMSFAAVCMIVACLLIMGSFSLVAINLNHMLGDLERENEFLAYVDESLTEDQARALQSSLAKIPNVDSVTFVSRNEAMQEFMKGREDQELFQNLPDEVLRHRFKIHVVDLQKMSTTVSQVKQVEGIADVRADLEIAQGFVAMRNIARGVAIILITILLTISLFIIANTIKLTTFTRRNEIAIMKMCGATNWFIRWPFIFEGMLLGIFGALLAFFCQWGIYALIQNAVASGGGVWFITVLPFLQMASSLLLVFLGTGFAIGSCGSLLAIRKFLQV
ncbi:Cell division protein FtsX [bioreactor metagenome]|uniref:Cell division protein FtsX n=1 Tax=bioreactor metagenome TaxID=1076179 RepID=A0A644X2Z5_9ZZZZ